ncbi:MAG: hypothetical protein HQ592_02270, partial [Planctomycetes bacterium]|nr:hypothetical protein [Planctomycetota bacterium]
MTKPRPAYDSEGARILERYFKRNIAPHLTNGKGDRDTRACTTYLLLVFLEQEQGGLCRPITVDTKTAADRFYVARATLGRTLRVLAACDAIEFLSGQSVLRNAKATQIRRRTVKELEGGEFRAELRPHTPADASEICRVLGGRSFCYNGEQISPRFSAESTGRIYTSSPSPQLDDGKARLKKALTGAKPGQWILEVDYRQ